VGAPDLMSPVQNACDGWRRCHRPSGVFARSLGDTVTRLDRIETALNEALPGDPRDTMSPAAMVTNMRLLLVGDKLSPPSREQLPLAEGA